MSSKRKSRDTLGRFIPDTDEMDSSLLELPKIKFWRGIKAIIFFCLVVVVSLPWSVIFFEPAKIYSGQFVDYVSNFTASIRDNACSCKSLPCKSSF